MSRPQFETPNGILAAAQECGYGDAQFRQLVGRDGLALVDRFLEAFTVRGLANRSSVRFWEDLREPWASLSGPVNLEVLLALAPADTRIWLLVEDWSRRKREAPVWAFDATLAAAIGTLQNHHLLEFSIAARSFEWAVAENHHDVLMGVGSHAVAFLQTLRPSGDAP